MVWSCAMEPKPTVSYFSMEIGLDPAVPGIVNDPG
jgi:hypothetical protein